MVKSYYEYHDRSEEQRHLRVNGCGTVTCTVYTVDTEDDRLLFKATGTERMTLADWRTKIVTRAVYVPVASKDGKRRHWEFAGTIRSKSVHDCSKIVKIVMAGKEYSLRKK